MECRRLEGAVLNKVHIQFRVREYCTLWVQDTARFCVWFEVRKKMQDVVWFSVGLHLSRYVKSWTWVHSRVGP